jgi:thiol:disulfide interchange protein DsbC
MRPWLTVVLALASGVSSAAPATAVSDATTESRIKSTLEARYPDSKIETVLPSNDIAGWYEVVTSTGIAYTNPNADLMLIGTLTDTRSKENLGEKRWGQLHTIDFKSLPFDRAIRVVKGDGRRQMAVFADPDCPYCRRLEQQLRDVSDVTIYIFLFPINELHPNASVHAEQIWCADDPAKTWAAWVLERKDLPEKWCGSTPIAELAQLGAKLKVFGTPTIFLADGQRIVGAIDKADLERRLTEASAATQVVAAH